MNLSSTGAGILCGRTAGAPLSLQQCPAPVALFSTNVNFPLFKLQMNTKIASLSRKTYVKKPVYHKILKVGDLGKEYPNIHQASLFIYFL